MESSKKLNADAAVAVDADAEVESVKGTATQDQDEESAADRSKKPKLDTDAMEVDSALSAQATRAMLSSSLKEAITTIGNGDILSRLRPVVFRSKRYDDMANLCSDLAKIDFLEQWSSMIAASELQDVLNELAAIYSQARGALAAEIRTTGRDVEATYCEVAVEIRHAILWAELLDINRNNHNEASGMQVYNNLVPHLQQAGIVTTVVVRRQDREFWDRCIELSLEDHPVCGVGNPGIGKTTTTFYLLQQLVMIQRKPVVYTIRNVLGEEDIFYELVPVVADQGSGPVVTDVTVSVHRLLSKDRTQIPSVRVQGAFYVVDPGTYEHSCNVSSQLFEARFIMNASNDSKHWGGNNFTKYREANSTPNLPRPRRPNAKSGVLVYGCLWTGSQLIVAKPYLRGLDGLSDNQVLYRFRIVGGSIRDILEFNQDSFKQKVENALNLDPTTVNCLAEGNYMFTFDRTAPSSILIGLGPNEENPELHKTTLKSDFVEEILASRHLKMSWYARLDEDNAGNRGNLFESYLRLKFSTEPVEFSEDEVRESHRETPPPTSKDKRKNYQSVTGGMTVGSKRTIKRVSKMVASVRDDPSLKFMYYSKNEYEELIDMICRVPGGYDAIQATASMRHGSAVEKIRTLVDELGLGSHERLRIFFAVPLCRYAGFETSPVNPLLNQADLSNVFIYHVGVSANE